MKHNKERFVWMILFLLIFILCFLFPYTGDDWAWGSSIGVDRWNSRFQNYSGRYVGNMIVLILTRFRVLRALVMAVCLLAITYMIVKICDGKYAMAFLIIGLLFAAPKPILRQSIVWTSGFSNYGISITLFLVYIFLITCVFGNQNQKKSRLLIRAAALFILGYLGAMVVEHITVMQIIVGGGIALAAWIKKKDDKVLYISYVTGSIIGAVTMFSNGCYTAAVAGTDNYRSIATSVRGLLNNIIVNYFDVIGKQMILDNILLELFTAVVITVLFVQKMPEWKENRGILEASVILIDVSAFYGLITRINTSWSQTYGVGRYVDGLVNIVFWLSLLLFTVFMGAEESKKVRMGMILLGIACADGCLLLVSPIGSRCFLACYILLIWYCMESLTMITYASNTEKMIEKISILTAGIIVGMNFAVYGSLYKQDVQRLKVIRQADREGAKEVVVEELQYGDYLHYARLDGIWQERYKMFYGISPELEITCD